MPTVTIVDGDRATEVAGAVERGTVLLSPHALEEATGWDLRAEGLCRGDVCVPRREHDGLLVDEQIDLAAFATLMHRPLAFEPAAGIAVLADSPAEQAAQMSGRTTPAFALPDLDGNPVNSATYSGKKRLFVAWASW